jgi:hypothetical protein
MKTRQAKEIFDTEIKASWYDPDEKFEFLSVPYQRSVSSTHVNNIVRTLHELEQSDEGPHFTEPLVVNMRENGKPVLLDGYHRMEAMKKYGKKVKLKIEIYDGLSLEEEKSIYEDYNIGKKHTVLDLIRPQINKNAVLKELINKCQIPLTLYVNNKRGVALTAFLNSYKRSLFEEDKDRNKLTLQEFCLEKITETDAERLIKFSEWYTTLIGEYAQNSDFYSPNFIAVCMYTYHNTIRLDQFENRLKNFKFDAEVRQIMNASSGFTGFKLLLRTIQDRINKSLKRPII